MLAEYARSADQETFPTEVHNSRPTSLPSYLLESYSRIHLSHMEAADSAAQLDSRYVLRCLAFPVLS